MEGRWLGAVLACGSGLPLDKTSVDGTPIGTGTLEHWGAALSHRSAAELWKLLPASDHNVDISIRGISGKRRRRGVHVHRSRTLIAEMVTSRRRIPVTSPARTITDLQRATRTRGCPASVTEGELRQAIRQAEVLGLAIEELGSSDRTRSDLEALFLQLCRRAKLPSPEVNVRIAPFLVDFLWSDRGLIVETDGYRYHGGRQAFEADRDRDLRLKAMGYEVIRLSYRQVVAEAKTVAGTLRRLLADPPEIE
jgi:very-short-patch-repair endonuclease